MVGNYSRLKAGTFGIPLFYLYQKFYKFWFVFLQVIEAYLGDILFEAWRTEQHTLIHVLVYVSVQNSVRQGAIKSSIEHPFILCQLLQLYFYRPDAILDAQPTVSKC